MSFPSAYEVAFRLINARTNHAVHVGMPHRASMVSSFSKSVSLFRVAIGPSGTVGLGGPVSIDATSGMA